MKTQTNNVLDFCLLYVCYKPLALSISQLRAHVVVVTALRPQIHIPEWNVGLTSAGYPRSSACAIIEADGDSSSGFRWNA